MAYGSLGIRDGVCRVLIVLHFERRGDLHPGLFESLYPERSTKQESGWAFKILMGCTTHWLRQTLILASSPRNLRHNIAELMVVLSREAWDLQES